jgi:hypothetical protein
MISSHGCRCPPAGVAGHQYWRQHLSQQVLHLHSEAVITLKLNTGAGRPKCLGTAKKDSGPPHISFDVMTRMAMKKYGLIWRGEGRYLASAAMLIGCCRPQTRVLLERWRNDMLNTSKAHLITEDGQDNWTVTDQLALTLIFAVRSLFSRLSLHTLRAKYVSSLTDRRSNLEAATTKCSK